MLAWKIGPALAAGCSVIVKPAEQTSLTALRMAELAVEAGVPRGVFQVLPGDGPSVGEPLGMHMDIDMVSFTGSTETGRRFLRYAADSNLKKVVLECGGKNPAVVLADAENLDLVAGHVVNAAFWNMVPAPPVSTSPAFSIAIVSAPVPPVIVMALDPRAAAPIFYQMQFLQG